MHDALASSGTSAVHLHNFRNCGACATAQWSEALQKRRLTAFYCHNRHCEPCARSKANKIGANLTEKLRDAPRGSFRFLTFTLKHNPAPLTEQIARIYKCFKRLRASKEWKRTQVGGAVILEVKWTGKAWHPHLHVISQGKFIKKADLVRLWLKVTGDSFIVDVQLIDRARDAAAYVCKYITKSTSDSVWQNLSRAQEWIAASKGLRTANTFGTWRKYPLTRCTKKATDWQAEDTLVRLMKRDREGDRVARDILNNMLTPGHEYEAHIYEAVLDDSPYTAPQLDDDPFP